VREFALLFVISWAHTEFNALAAHQNPQSRFRCFYSCSEPNALFYFWGDAHHFGQIASATSASLVNAGVSDFYCCGYASTFNGGPAAFNMTPDAIAHGFTMDWYSAALQRYRPARLSWHLYLGIGRSRPAIGYDNSYDNIRW
jgi:hypothetical protein